MSTTKRQKYSKSLCLAATAALVFSIVSLVYFLTWSDYYYYTRFKIHEIEALTETKYLVNTSTCKVPYIDPHDGQFKPKTYTQCSQKSRLTYIEENKTGIYLVVNKTAQSEYSMLPIYCCYSNVSRAVQKSDPDNIIEISGCKHFNANVEINHWIVKVQCRILNVIKVYSDVHAITSPRFIHTKPLSGTSILILGIDSMSRTNLMRTMPITYNFVNTKAFVNLKAHTKIGENTLPNVIGFLEGKTRQQIEEKCKLSGFVDKCGWIWDRFRQANYVTAYAEDGTELGTFNYLSKGFKNPPTDLYYRPYMISAENFNLIKMYLNYCTGPLSAGQRILNAVQDFMQNLKGYRKFGLFWANTFSHDDVNLPQAMDVKVYETLKTILENDENTIVFFISDHGFRFGEERRTQKGWLEERLPFFYARFPDKFQREHPEFYANFMTNSHRLTTAFDLHMTLQDILRLETRNNSVIPSEACPKCKSLFQEIPENRTCEDAAILPKFCVCGEHLPIETDHILVRKSVKFVLREVNKMVQSYEQKDKCATYELDRVFYAGVSDFTERNETKSSLLLRIQMSPGAQFEILVDVSNESSLRIIGDFSRLDRYAENSYCIVNSPLEKYCYCKNHWKRLLRKLSCAFVFC